MEKNDIKFLCRGIQKRNICGDSKSKKDQRILFLENEERRNKDVKREARKREKLFSK